MTDHCPLTRREYRRLLQAISVAIRDEIDFIDCQKGWVKRQGKIVMGISKQNRPAAQHAERSIAAWRSIAVKIRAHLGEPKTG